AVDAKSGQSERSGVGSLFDRRPDGEIRAVGTQQARVARFDDPDLDGRFVEPAERQGLHLIAEVLSAPYGGLGTKANVAVLLGRERVARLGQIDARLYEIARRQLLGQLLPMIGRKRGLWARLGGLGQRLR